MASAVESCFQPDPHNFQRQDLPGSVVRPWKGRWRHRVVVKAGLTPRSNKARSARPWTLFATIASPLPNHRTRCHARTRSRDRFCGWAYEKRIVHWVFTECAAVFHFMTERSEQLLLPFPCHENPA